MIYEGTERFVQFENQMKRVTTSIIALQLWHLSLGDSLSLVNDQTIPVGIAKCRPMADLRFSRYEEEGDAVVAQVSESGFKIVDFKCN